MLDDGLHCLKGCVEERKKGRKSKRMPVLLFIFSLRGPTLAHVTQFLQRAHTALVQRPDISPRYSNPTPVSGPSTSFGLLVDDVACCFVAVDQLSPQTTYYQRDLRLAAHSN